jgi:hypothetical protein
MSPFAFLLLIPLLISCGESSRLVFHDLKQEALDRIKQSEEQAERNQAQRIAKAIEQKRVMAEIMRPKYPFKTSDQHSRISALLAMILIQSFRFMAVSCETAIPLIGTEKTASSL